MNETKQANKIPEEKTLPEIKTDLVKLSSLYPAELLKRLDKCKPCLHLLETVCEANREAITKILLLMAEPPCALLSDENAEANFKIVLNIGCKAKKKELELTYDALAIIKNRGLLDPSLNGQTNFNKLMELAAESVGKTGYIPRALPKPLIFFMLGVLKKIQTNGLLDSDLKQKNFDLLMECGAKPQIVAIEDLMIRRDYLWCFFANAQAYFYWLTEEVSRTEFVYHAWIALCQSYGRAHFWLDLEQRRKYFQKLSLIKKRSEFLEELYTLQQEGCSTRNHLLQRDDPVPVEFANLVSAGQESLTWGQYYFHLLEKYSVANLGEGLIALQRKEREDLLLTLLPTLESYPVHADGVVAIYINHVKDDTLKLRPMADDPFLKDFCDWASDIINIQSLGHILHLLQKNQLLTEKNYQVLKKCASNLQDLLPILTMLQEASMAFFKIYLTQNRFDKLINALEMTNQQIPEKEEKRAPEIKVYGRERGVFDFLLEAIEILTECNRGNPDPNFLNRAFDAVLERPYYPHPILAQLEIRTKDSKNKEPVKVSTKDSKYKDFARAIYAMSPLLSPKKALVRSTLKNPAVSLRDMPLDVINNIAGFFTRHGSGVAHMITDEIPPKTKEEPQKK